MNNAGEHILSHRSATDDVLTYTCRDAAGGPIDFTGATVGVSIKDCPGGTELATQASFATAPAGNAAGLVTITITEAELLTLAPGDYALEVSWTKAGVTRKYPVNGSLVLRVLA